MFTRAIVKTPGESLIKGLTSADFGLPDYHLALEQHANYVQALRECGLAVRILAPDERYPDSTFVEDAALLTSRCALIMNPGAPSRKGEIYEIREVLKDYYTDIEEIHEPGTVEAGDIMMVGTHFYIGISQRTNENGAAQVIQHLAKYGMTGATVKLENVLHLKTGIAYLEKDTFAACGEFLIKPEFQGFNLLEIGEDESYAANCVWVNGTILLPAGYPKARKTIESAGYLVREVEVSEFRKLDGGLSCLSLRF